MKKALTEYEIAERVVKLRAWLQWVQDHYESTGSRNETAGAPSGFAEPRWNTFECAVCNGDDCETCQKVRQGQDVPKKFLKRKGRVPIRYVDPYTKDIHVFVKVNESEGSKKQQQRAAIDRELATLEHYAKIRKGVEAPVDRATGLYIRVSYKPSQLVKVAKGFALLQELSPSLYDDLPSYKALRAVVILMHRLVGGRFPEPPPS